MYILLKNGEMGGRSGFAIYYLKHRAALLYKWKVDWGRSAKQNHYQQIDGTFAKDFDVYLEDYERLSGAADRRKVGANPEQLSLLFLFQFRSPVRKTTWQ